MNFLEEKELYLIPDLKLDLFAEQFSVCPRVLSEIINKEFKTNFNDYINSYRINHSIQLLKENCKSQNITISEIMYCSGFNSRSVFYVYFKDKTGKTPKEFKKFVCNHNNEQ